MDGGAASRNVGIGGSSASAPFEKPSDNNKPVFMLDGQRAMHSSWASEADMLTQLRDEVREAADREKAEILADTRRRIREDGRRELLLLSEQVHASLGGGQRSRDTVDSPARTPVSAAATNDTRPSAASVANAAPAMPPELDDLWADFRSLP